MRITVLCCSFVLILAANVESRAAVQTLDVSEILKEHSRTTEEFEKTAFKEDKANGVVDDKTDEDNISSTSPMNTGLKIIGQIVKRSTDVFMKKSIDWESFKVTLVEIVRTVYQFVSEVIKKLTSTYSSTFVPFVKQRLLPALVPFSSTFVDHPAVRSAMASSTSVDWHSAATALFDNLVKFTKLTTNEA